MSKDRDDPMLFSNYWDMKQILILKYFDSALISKSQCLMTTSIDKQRPALRNGDQLWEADIRIGEQ